MTRNWQPGCQYNNGDVVEYCGAYYRIIQSHHSQGDWTPDATPALWGKIPEHEAHQHQSSGGQHQSGGYGSAPQSYGQQSNNSNNGGGGYGYGSSEQQPLVPEHSDDPRKQKQDGFDLGGFHVSDDQMKIGGGILGTAAALGIGAFAFDKYKDSKEEKKDQQWADSNWEVDAHRRQGEYLEAIKANQSLPPVSWVLTEGNNIPQGAIVGGKEADNELLYIARAFHEHGVHVGKVSRKMKEGCHIAYGGKEIAKQKYEILLGYERSVRWIDCQGAMNVQSARPVEGGKEADGKPLYIAQAFVKNGVHPGKCGSHLRDGASIAYGDDEKTEKNYRVLVYSE